MTEAIVGSIIGSSFLSVLLTRLFLRGKVHAEADRTVGEAWQMYAKTVEARIERVEDQAARDRKEREEMAQDLATMLENYNNLTAVYQRLQQEHDALKDEHAKLRNDHTAIKGRMTHLERENEELRRKG